MANLSRDLLKHPVRDLDIFKKQKIKINKEPEVSQPLHRKFSQYQEMKNDPEVKKIINCALGVKETRDLSKKQQENQLRLLEQCTVYKETKEIVAKEFKENPKRLKAITVEFLERHA